MKNTIVIICLMINTVWGGPITVYKNKVYAHQQMVDKYNTIRFNLPYHLEEETRRETEIFIEMNNLWWGTELTDADKRWLRIKMPMMFSHSYIYALIEYYYATLEIGTEEEKEILQLRVDLLYKNWYREDFIRLSEAMYHKIKDMNATE